MKKGKAKKVLVALSGGIDSAVSAHLLIKKGYEVEAAFMKNWSSTEGLLKNDCPWLADRQDALRVAAFLRVPLHTLDFEKQYQDKVMKYFFSEYKKGRTPNPDVMCNKEIKFKLLYDWARKNGFDYLATGHYANIRHVVSRKVVSRKTPYSLPTTHYSLERSADEFKDQTYFIYNIKAAQLPRLLFPIGGMIKAAVRALAKKINLPNAEKRESMGLCFVGKIRLKDFLEQKLKEKPGEIVMVNSVLSPRNFSRIRLSSAAKNIRGPEISLVSGSRVSPKDNLISSPGMAETVIGRHRGLHNYTLHPHPSAKGGHLLPKGEGEEVVIGQHRGLHNYTLGQRQGIAVGGNGPYYVVKKDLHTNRLYVTNNPDDPLLLTKEVQLHSANWLLPNFQSDLGSRLGRDGFSIFNFQLLGRYRHQGELVPLTISRIKTDLYRVVFNHPQKAVASGQSLVLYDEKVCVGGGIIA